MRFAFGVYTLSVATATTTVTFIGANGILNNGLKNGIGFDGKLWFVCILCDCQGLHVFVLHMPKPKKGQNNDLRACLSLCHSCHTRLQLWFPLNSCFLPLQIKQDINCEHF